MNHRGYNLYKLLIINALGGMSKINKSRQKFMVEIFILFLSIKGKINFLQLFRFGKYSEFTYRLQFDKEFDFLNFNLALLPRSEKILAFDPSYLPKAGKHTPGVGYFWSGCANSTKWGIEINVMAAVDIDQHTAYSLNAFQTVNLLEGETLLKFYARGIVTKAESYLKVSKYLTVDAYFSKKTFVEPVCLAGFEIISRLRDDSDLKYIHEPSGDKPTRGRPKLYGKKLNFECLDLLMVEESESQKIYSGVVYSKALNRQINLVVVYSLNKNGKWTHKLYFSTDLKLNWENILQYYALRFQVEFLIRDSKQHTGLSDCQARGEQKINFQVNTSLSAVNLAKKAYLQEGKRSSFSMSNAKTMLFNELMISRFLDEFGINPNLPKNRTRIDKLRELGKIAA